MIIVMPHHIQYAALVVRRIELYVPWETGIWAQNIIDTQRLGPPIVINDHDGEHRTRPLFVLFYDDYCPSWQSEPPAFRFHDD